MQWSQEKRRPLLCKTLEGIIRCIVVYVKMLNWKTQWYLKKVCTIFEGACAFTGIHHYDVIVFIDCFHPTTRVQQNGFFKNLYSEERFWKGSFFGDRFYLIDTKRDTCGWGPNMTDMKQFSYQTNWSFVVRKRRGSPAGRNCMIWLSNLHTVKFKNVMPSSSLSHYQRPHPARFLFPNDQSPSGVEGPQTGDCVSSDIQTLIWSIWQGCHK